MSASPSQTAERILSSKTVSGLQLKWVTETAGDVTATPAVENGSVYAPDTAGYLYKFDAATGAIIWSRPIADYTGIPGDYATATPAIAGDALILGNNSGTFLGPGFGQSTQQPARVFAVNKHTGEPLWVTQVDNTTFSYVSSSVAVVDGKAIVGVSSNEELIAAFVPTAYWQWNFRGNVVALDVETGQIIWKTYTTPSDYYGAAVDFGTSAIDLKSATVYVATGHNYAVPQAVLDCLESGATPQACTSPANHFNSVIALDLNTGQIKWSSRSSPTDVWNASCGFGIPGVYFPPGSDCPFGDPTTAGPAQGFAQGPMLLPPKKGDKSGKRLAAIGQKNGMFWAFDQTTGAAIWQTQVAPGGFTGGHGSAADDKSIYVAVSNSGPTTNGLVAGLPWTLQDGTTTTAGGWAALSTGTGAVLWTTKDPVDSRSLAPVSLASDVVYGCNLVGRMYALSAATGAVLWSYDSGGACVAAPSIVDGTVYWGNGGRSGLSIFTFPGTKRLFAFGLPD
jgi:polyvinyl alcohol dehydrogenase (cytochrome)